MTSSTSTTRTTGTDAITNTPAGTRFPPTTVTVLDPSQIRFGDSGHVLIGHPITLTLVAAAITSVAFVLHILGFVI